VSFETTVLGAVGIIPLILGIVEFAKKFGLHGKWCELLAVLLGIGFVGLMEAIAQGLVPEAALPYLGVVVAGLAGGLAAAGLYDLGKSYVQKAVALFGQQQSDE